MSAETIELVAIRIDGVVTVTEWGIHADAIVKAIGEDVEWPAFGNGPGEIQEGFVTSRGRFVQRDEAWHIARAYLSALQTETQFLETCDWEAAVTRSQKEAA